jgi:hypothetical protein
VIGHRLPGLQPASGLRKNAYFSVPRRSQRPPRPEAPPREVRDPLVAGDKRAGKLDRGGDQQAIGRVAAPQPIEPVCAADGTVVERHGGTRSDGSYRRLASTRLSRRGSPQRAARRRCRARVRYGCRAAGSPSPVDLATVLRFGDGVENRCRQIDPFAHGYRAAMRAEQRAGAGVGLEQAANRQGHRLGLVAAGEPRRRLAFAIAADGSGACAIIPP